MAAFGYFHTESSHHASEYLPYFRKEPGAGRVVHPEALGLLRGLRRPRRGGAVRGPAGQAESRAGALGRVRRPSSTGLETGRPQVIYGNVANRGLIPNLPAGLLCRSPLPGRPQRRPADGGRAAAAAVRGGQPDQRQRPGAGGRGGPHRRPGARLPRGDARPADRRPADARADPGDGRRAVHGRGGVAAGLRDPALTSRGHTVAFRTPPTKRSLPSASGAGG